MILVSKNGTYTGQVGFKLGLILYIFGPFISMKGTWQFNEGKNSLLTNGTWTTGSP